ncbi:restriction endonuclease subunit S [Enterococcus faecium]|uniref:restriction endonuclease subunit S n=1 Tax=Enterococcus faecium TaxID=1352 RepID=UPI003CE5C5C5
MSNDTRPEIRFPGFTDDWEQRKLGEIVQITMGQSPNSENYTENPEDYILVQGNADMKNNRVVPRVWTTQITKQAEKGDLILSVRAPVGDIGKTDYDVVLGRGVAAIKGNDFIFQQLGKMKESGYWNRFSTGSTFESINSNDIREALITIPTGEEQQKIGTFFKQLDDTIALQQRKLDLLKETKKGFLQKMFPKNGAKVPEIRFPGFTEDWEQRKLKEFGKSTGGTSIESEFVEGGKYKVISIGSYSEQSVYTDQNIRAELTDKTRNRVLNKGDLTMILNDKTASGNIIGRVLLIDSNDSYVYNQRTERIEPDHKKYDSQFLYHMLNAPMIRSKIIKQAQGNTQIYVNWSAIGELDYLVPNLDEQREIGAFFFNLNNLITLHQRKLDLLKETKKGFLQKMFV